MLEIRQEKILFFISYVYALFVFVTMSTYYCHFLKESKNIYSTANPGHLGPTEKPWVQNLPFPEIPSQLEDQPAPPPGT